MCRLVEMYMSGRTVGWLFGGMACAIGIISMMFSWDTGAATTGSGMAADMALSLDRLGWDAVSDIAPNSTFPIAVVALLLGAPTLIYLNATQWRNTGGY